MSIPITPEPDDMGPPFERCFFCDTPTPMWYEKVDIPVCTVCAEKHDVSEVPSKQEWMNKYIGTK